MQQERWSQLLTWSVAAAAGFLLALPAFSVFSDEGGPAGGTKFYDSERLVDTLMRDDEGELVRAREDVERAEAELQEAIDAGLPQEEIDEREELLELAEAELEETELYFDEELALVREQVAELSAAQLFALNRSLNNTLSNGLLPDLDSDELQARARGELRETPDQRADQGVRGGGQVPRPRPRRPNDSSTRREIRHCSLNTSTSWPRPRPRRTSSSPGSTGSRPARSARDARSRAAPGMRHGCAARTAARDASRDGAKLAAHDSAKLAAKRGREGGISQCGAQGGSGRGPPCREEQRPRRGQG